MRCKKMRGYGSWCIGWREGDRSSRHQPTTGDGNGCGLLMFGFLVLVALTLFKIAIETGNGLGLILGFAIIAGLLKSKI